MNPAALWTGRLRSLAWSMTWLYVVVFGGSPAGEFSGWTQAINEFASFALIVAWVRGLRRGADQIDTAVLLVVLTFAATSVLSEFPRVSFDAYVRVAALAAAFWMLRRAATMSAVYESAERALGWLCIAVGAVFAAVWVAALLNWLNTAHWSVLPPLSLQLPTVFFGHKHDLALLIVLLMPATLSPAFRERRWIGWAGIGLATIMVLIDASRNVWMAIAVATAAVFVLRGRRPRMHLGKGWLLAGTFMAVGSIAAVAVFLPTVISRIGNLWTAGARLELWSAAIALWLQHPLTGTGPGTFPFAFLQTDHFAHSTFDPRHPDSAIVQLAVEAGVLGLLAVAGALALMARAARRTRRHNSRALWACLVFLLACVAANPSDFVFLSVPAMFWAAMLTPATRAVPARTPMWHHQNAETVAAAVRVGALSTLGVALVLASSASVLYEIGRDRYSTGDTSSAIHAVRVAGLLDPAQPFYWRELGALELEGGSAELAAADYKTALALVPLDPVALRGLALAEFRLGTAEATGLAHRAVELKPLQPANWVVQAIVADEPDASQSLVRALVLNPLLAASDWAGTALVAFNRDVAVRDAALASARSPAKEDGTGPLLLNLFVSAGSPADAARAVEPGFAGATKALLTMWRCDFGRASRLIDGAESAEREQGFFWLARSLIAFPARGDSESAGALARLYEGVTRRTVSAGASLLSEGMGDVWRYRHYPLSPVGAGLSVPSRTDNLWALTTDPATAMRLKTWPPNCSH